MGVRSRKSPVSVSVVGKRQCRSWRSYKGNKGRHDHQFGTRYLLRLLYDSGPSDLCSKLEYAYVHAEARCADTSAHWSSRPGLLSELSLIIRYLFLPFKSAFDCVRLSGVVKGYLRRDI